MIDVMQVGRILPVVLLMGCGPIVGMSGDSGGTTTSGTTTDRPGGPSTEPGDPSVADVATGIPPDPATSVDPDPTIDPDTSSDTVAGTFIIEPDGGWCFTHCGDCDVWAQDCPRGEKCTAWANDGGNAWNATRCSTYGDDQVGDTCSVEGSAVSGLDSCTIGAMCWNVDPDTNIGECVALCGGSEANPECPGGCDTCLVSNDGVINLCLERCNPALPMCAADQACLPVADDSFVCAPSPVDTPLGEVCDTDGDCMPGLRCAPAGQLPACEGASCCAPWCDPIGMDPCAAMPGTVCVPAVPGVRGCTPEVGACLVPN